MQHYQCKHLNKKINKKIKIKSKHLLNIWLSKKLFAWLNKCKFKCTVIISHARTRYLIHTVEQVETFSWKWTINICKRKWGKRLSSLPPSPFWAVAFLQFPHSFSPHLLSFVPQKSCCLTYKLIYKLQFSMSPTHCGASLSTFSSSWRFICKWNPCKKCVPALWRDRMAPHCSPAWECQSRGEGRGPSLLITAGSKADPV